MRQRSCLVVLLVLIAVGTTVAQEVSPTQFFPVVARTTGAGQPPTQWVTDLVIANLMANSVTVGLQFFPEGQANAIDPSFPIRVILRPRETLLIEDVLSSRFGYDSNVKGALLLTCDPDMMMGSGNSWHDAILATTRTYNVGSPEGTFGQTIPSLMPLANAYATQSFVTGARNDSRFRSNLGIANMSTGPITVHFRIMVGNVNILAVGTRTVDAFSMKQWSFPQLGVGQVEGAITVDLWLDPDDVTPNPCDSDWPNSYMAYVSKVDGNPQGTGDAEFLYATPVQFFYCDD